MGIAAIIALIIVLAIVLITVILVITEFSKVKKDISKEDSLSRANESVLGKNIITSQSNVSRALSSTTTNLLNKIQEGDNTVRQTLQEADQDLLGRLQAADNDIYQTIDTKTQQVYAEAVEYSDLQMAPLTNDLMTIFTDIGKSLSGLSSYFVQTDSNNDGHYFIGNGMFVTSPTDSNLRGTLSYTPQAGIAASNPNGPTDFTAPTAAFNTVTLAGNLSFANQNSSYMLGVDGTQMFLDMGGAGEMAIRSGTESNITINRLGVRVNTPLEAGGLKLYDTNGTSTMEGPKIMMRSADGDVGIDGRVRATNDLCINQTCVTEADLLRLKNMTATAAPTATAPTAPAPTA